MFLLVGFRLKRENEYFTPVYESTLRLVLMMWACVVMNWMITTKSNFILRIFKWLGTYSLEIYVLHMLLIGNVKRLMVYAGMDNEWIPVSHTLATFSIVLLICKPVHIGINKITKSISLFRLDRVRH